MTDAQTFADLPALAPRLDNFAGRLASAIRVATPSNRPLLEELLAEFHALQRAILSAALPPAAPPVPSRETPAEPPERPVPTRTLDYPCSGCGGPLVVAVKRRGRLPTRCVSCRGDLTPDDPNVRGARNRESWRTAHPAEGQRRCAKCHKAKPDDDAHFRLKDPRTGMRDSYCRPCRGEYAADRYARVGTRVVIVELCAGDVCLGASCPQCGRPFSVGDRVMGDHLRHVECPAVS